MSEKTEDATPQKLQESRKKGQVSQSQDIPKLLICIGVLEMIFALVVVLRILGGWVQFGPLFAVEAMMPKLETLNPVNHFKNIFSARQLTQLLTSIIKAVIIGLIVWQAIMPELPALAQLALGTLDGFWQGVMALFIKVARRVLLVMLALSLLDFGLQKYFFLKQQRMSHDDIKNEFKQSEGDPHMKGHRRQVAQEILHEEPAAPRQVAVEEADMLLVNPTHFAVGLYYRPGETPLPRLLFKASDDEARSLIEQAQRKKMPVIRFVWLTRTLYRTTKEGAYIPRETLTAVAQVYRLLRELEDHYLDEVIEMREE
ncbi:EscU/YscU/HrcU family type III secretion system export apparatus switch protein [Erwinia sp. V71]|uniref:EscU/YscU/HrcU family type III secretion system export apparatus switch protein n=1 Tax=Erwinia sp. V71 TaxID=3369424 RepID=UPI003F62149E